MPMYIAGGREGGGLSAQGMVFVLAFASLFTRAWPDSIRNVCVCSYIQGKYKNLQTYQTNQTNEHNKTDVNSIIPYK